MTSAQLWILAATLAACDRQLPHAAPPAPPATAPVTPVAQVSASPAPLVPAVPVLDPDACVPGDRPTHLLVVSASEYTLDGAPLGRGVTLAAAVQARVDDHTLALAIAPDLPFNLGVRSLLLELQDIPELRLWISVRVGDDPELRHVPVLPTELDALKYRLGLPPATYTLRLDGDREVLDWTNDPYMLPAARNVLIDRLLVIPGDDSPWQVVAAALAIPCGGATLIEPPMTPQRLRTPAVRLGPVTTTSDAAYQDLVRRIVRAHVTEVRYCYNVALRRDPATRGRVAIAFTIDARGKIASAAVAENTSVDNALAVCIAAAVRRWSFVKPKDGREVAVRFSWLLEPG